MSLNASTTGALRSRISELGPWFQNIDLAGVATAPDHFLGDYPNVKWRRFADALPADLSGKTVLDIGCNACFYGIEMKRRGAARVVGIDTDDRYLEQGRFAAEVLGFDIELQKLSVYDVATLEETYDLVLFMGVFYHLRHPLLALDLLHEHVVRDTLVFQSMLRGGPRVEPLDRDYSIKENHVFYRESFPRMYFVEHCYADDQTNWWIPNRAGAEAMLRSSGFEIVARPEAEILICRRTGVPDPLTRSVYPARGRDG